MGTSTSHRSPVTPEWERVRELYRQPNPEPGQVVGRIVQALDPATRAAMADTGVALCLDAMLTGAQQVATSGLGALLEDTGLPVGGPVALSFAAALRGRAQERIVEWSAASRFAELAVDALAVTAMEIATGSAPALLTRVTPADADARIGGFAREGRLHELSGHFLGYDLDRAFRYFVDRDLSDFVGTPAVPTVGQAHQLLDRVAAFCRDSVRRLPLEPAEPLLRETLAAPETDRLPRLQGFLLDTVSQGFDLMAAGGAP